jgi:hypothetical protein
MAMTMAPRLAFVTFMAIACGACGAAEQVDEVVGASREPQATTGPRSCPQFGRWLMLPRTPAIGVPAEISVNVTDPDSPLEKLAFQWVAGSGSFSEPSSADTSFTCEHEGYQTLALVVRDETGCARQLDIQISCFPR